jgi:hypothetical protein
MPKLIETPSAKSEDIPLPYGSDTEMSSLVFQVVKSGGWNGSLVLQSRVRGASAAVPFTNSPYQDLVTTQDIDAGIAITDDGKFAARADLQEWKLVHTYGTQGSVIVAARDGRG